MSSLLKGIKVMMQRYPVVRGMLSYSLLLPASNTTQQLLDPQRKKYDPWETFRFGIYGSFLLAPTLYCWVRLANIIVKANSLKGAIIKAYIEQFTWAPFAYVQFFICINLMERKPWEECLHQCRTKILDTWKVGFCIWPVVQTVNFWIIPMKNRVSFVAFFSYLWNTFLSFMHHRELLKEL
ncbi:mitochondrial inner membrane protein Mpv17-like [Panulirus ornatus]|uniref:mitochondrial inner membrane protein Mpv17-like n=1 Tax=Panulirus ornatus TaxID=150431 RepID=UPI003A89BAEF